MTQGVNEQIGILAAIKPERHFFEVRRKMLCADFVPCSQKAPEMFAKDTATGTAPEKVGRGSAPNLDGKGEIEKRLQPHLQKEMKPQP